MSTGAVVMMIVAMVILWGGLLASVAYAVKAPRAARAREAQPRGDT